MEPIVLHKLMTLQKRFYELENVLEHSNGNNNKYFHDSYKEHAQLFDIVMHFEDWININKKIVQIKEMLSDTDMYDIIQEELEEFYKKRINIEKIIKMLLLPKDPHENCGCFVELRAGTGGKEAAIFAGELFRMYSRYVEDRKWKMDIVHVAYAESGGYKEIIAKISCQGSYNQLRFESGGHRVQRVPYTESQGRIHTSTCTVAVIPKISNITSININPHDLRIDSFRSSGSGGQHVNTTDSAIRITHIPSGLSVECQDERSQHKNKAKALSVLSSRLYAIDMQKRQKKESDMRRNLIGTGDRSDRIRTYNFQQGRVTDHRIAFTSYKLNDIMNGKLDILIQPIIHKYDTELLNQILKSK